MSETLINLMIVLSATACIFGAAWHVYDERNDEH